MVTSVALAGGRPILFAKVREKGGASGLLCHYIQSYVAAGAGDGWWPDEHDPGVRGIDQFLADAHSLGRGMGTQMVREFVQFLFEDPAVTRIQVDPAPSNLRAIRCYEKAGFRRVGVVSTPDAPAMLMVMERPSNTEG